MGAQRADLPNGGLPSQSRSGHFTVQLFPPLSFRTRQAGPATCQGEGDIKHQGLLESGQAIPTHLSLLPDLDVVGIQETLTSEIEALCWGTQVLQVRRRSKIYGLGGQIEI